MPKKHIDTALPSDTDLERSIIATCFVSDQAEVSTIVDLITPEYFYSKKNQEVFQAIVDVAFKAVSVDLPSVANRLLEKGKLESIGVNYLAKTIDSPLAMDIEYSCGKLEERFLLRKTIEYCYATIKRCQSGDEFDSVVDYFADSAKKIADGSNAGDPVIGMSELAMEASEVYGRRFNDQRMVTGIPSGIHDLDAATYGFHPGDLTLIAARPGMGKTALALNICKNAAEIGHGSLFISLEMPMQQLFDRLVAIDTKIDGMKIRIGNLTEKEFENVNDSVARLYELPMFIDDRGGMTFNEIRKTIRRQVKIHPEIKFVIVDHIQLVHGSNPQNRNLEIGEISMGLKALSKELKLPVICLSQLNRDLERRNNPYRRPKLSDLRDSGSLEQDADNIIFIYRPSVYGDNADPTNPNETIEILDSDCELILSKQRQGITCTVPCSFHDKIQMFDSEMKVSPDVLYQQKKEQKAND